MMTKEQLQEFIQLLDLLGLPKKNDVYQAGSCKDLRFESSYLKPLDVIGNRTKL